LNELRTERSFQGLCAGPGDEHSNVIAAEVRQDLSDADHEIENALGLFRVVPLIVAPDDVFGTGIDDYRFHRGGPDVQTYNRLVHQNARILLS
jgi:hypothetical protein